MAFVRLDIGSAVSTDHARHILNGLRDRTLPKAEWTHGAHLTAAVTLLHESDFESASAQMPDMIRGYNASLGGVNSDTEGYHHTITLFYLKLIAAFCAQDTARSIGDGATALLSSPFAERDFPLQCYTKDLLFSVEARRDWTAPDLQSIESAFNQNRVH